jgi:7-cyano-7-deazaguanine synthase
MKHDLVILYSGGLDSTVLLHMARSFEYNPICLLIDYGQKNIRELDAARAMCDKMSVSHREMSFNIGINSGLTGSHQTDLYKGVYSYYVPGRNTIFIGLAAALAESVGATHIWYGATFPDQSPDCQQGYINAMNGVLKVCAGYQIELSAPLLGMDKKTIRMLANLFHIDEKEVHSGYGV